MPGGFGAPGSSARRRPKSKLAGELFGVQFFSILRFSRRSQQSRPHATGWRGARSGERLVQPPPVRRPPPQSSGFVDFKRFKRFFFLALLATSHAWPCCCSLRGTAISEPLSAVLLNDAAGVWFFPPSLVRQEESPRCESARLTPGIIPLTTHGWFVSAGPAGGGIIPT